MTPPRGDTVLVLQMALELAVGRIQALEEALADLGADHVILNNAADRKIRELLAEIGSLKRREAQTDHGDPPCDARTLSDVLTDAFPDKA